MLLANKLPLKYLYTSASKDIFLVIGGSGFVRVCAEGLDGVYAVICEVSSAGHGDPRIAGGDHVRTCVACKNEHGRPEDNHGPALERALVRCVYYFRHFQSDPGCAPISCRTERALRPHIAAATGAILQAIMRFPCRVLQVLSQ